MNKVILLGNLTRDPESRSTTGGMSICNMSIAHNRKWKDAQGNPKEEVTFVDVTVFGRSADFCRDYMRKGNRVLIDGRLKLDVWTDATTGQNRQKLCVIAENVQNLSPRDPNQQTATSAQPTQQHQAPPPPPLPAANVQTQAQAQAQTQDEPIDDVPF